MKIDKIYITCYYKHLFFLRICVASIRYWNSSIPIYLIKDNSKKSFDTSEIEKHFNVFVADIARTDLGYYTKLLPFITGLDERFLVIDADLVWLGDLIQSLEQFEEDVIAVTVPPQEMNDSIGKWFFNREKLAKEYKDYHFPGFLFYAGQIVGNARKFSFKDFESVLRSKDFPVCDREDIFVGADQGILNYVVGKKINNGSLRFRGHNFMILRWTREMDEVNFNDIVEKKPKDFLVHWHGPKNGLISFLPKSEVLQFFEAFYYSRIKNGTTKMYWRRFTRTFRHLSAFTYEVLKKMYLAIKPR